MAGERETAIAVETIPTHGHDGNTFSLVPLGGA